MLSDLSRSDLRKAFTAETAAQKVRLAEDARDARDPARVGLAETRS